MTLVNYNGKYVSYKNKFANYVLPYLYIDVTTGTWDEYGTCCATSGPSIQVNIYTNTSWSASSDAGYVTSSINAGVGDGYTDISMTANEGGGGRGGIVTFSAPGCEDVLFYANQMNTGMTCA